MIGGLGDKGATVLKSVSHSQTDDNKRWRE